jgi:hypothetical protein
MQLRAEVLPVTALTDKLLAPFPGGVMHPYEPRSAKTHKTHESYLLKLRLERKMESQRLDNLKKNLQALASKTDNRTAQAA